MELVDSKIEWIGQIPSDWKTYSLSQVVEQVKNKNTDLSEKNLLSLSYGKIKRRDIDTTDGLLPASFDGYNIIEEGDIVLRLTDLQNDHTSLRVGRATERGIITSAYCTVRPGKNIDSEFLYYLLHAYDIKKGFYGMGAGVRQGLNYSEVKSLKISAPDIEAQKCIASHLTNQTKELDRILDEAKTTISDYRNLRTSGIREMISGMSDTNRSFKKCDIVGVDKIPETWKVIRLRFLCDIMTGNQDTQNSDPNGAYPFYVRSPIVEKANVYTYDGEGILMAGDGAGAGRVFHYATGKYAIHQRVYCFHNFRDINPKYFLYYIENMFPIIMDQGSAKSTVPSVRLPMIKDFQFCVPDRKEQDEIVTKIEKLSSQYEGLISEQENLISDIENYKQSVIYETVTGKRKVV